MTRTLEYLRVGAPSLGQWSMGVLCKLLLGCSPQTKDTSDPLTHGSFLRCDVSEPQPYWTTWLALRPGGLKELGSLVSSYLYQHSPSAPHQSTRIIRVGVVIGEIYTWGTRGALLSFWTTGDAELSTTEYCHRFHDIVIDLTLSSVLKHGHRLHNRVIAWPCGSNWRWAKIMFFALWFF